MTNLEKLQSLLIQKKIDAYIIPTSDYHMSEYVSEYFKARKFLSGFSGSAGTLLVTKSKAYLWTDGRYFIQAAKELEGSGIELMKMAQPGVPTIEEFLKKNLKSNQTLGFDFKVIETSYALKLKDLLKNINFLNIDLIKEVWTEDRPAMPFSILYKLDDVFCGESYSSKITRLRNKMKEIGATAHVLSKLEDQAWLYNLRADDVASTPVFLAFSLITLDNVYLFIDENKLNDDIKKYLIENKITIAKYDDIYKVLETLKKETFMVDYNLINYNIYGSIVNNNKLINTDNPTCLFKAIKNQVEIENTKKAHIKDGVAMVKAIYWLKTNVSKMEISEISFSDYLTARRSEQKGFIETSFTTIAGFKEHAAMMHYSATKESDYTLKDDGSFFLVDSGGHYLEGTTDITRTFALGYVSDEMKLHYTTVLKSVINLASAKFMYGCSGLNLDILARGPIWDLAIDYKCGTGHGVGHILSVHEAPNGIRYKVVPERRDNATLVPGMITTDEPGIYLEGKYGIRTENELLCKDMIENEWGHFLEFETITMCPIDLDAIEPSLLDEKQKNWLNNYHKKVYETLSPYLNADEKEWLKKYTKAI